MHRLKVLLLHLDLDGEGDPGDGKNCGRDCGRREQEAAAYNGQHAEESRVARPREQPVHLKGGPLPVDANPPGGIYLALGDDESTPRR